MTNLEVRQLVEGHPVPVAGLYERCESVGDLQVQVDGVALSDVPEDDLSVL